MPENKKPKHLRGSDIRGLSKLATQATAGVSRIAEGVHQSVWGSLGVPGGKQAGQTRGITRFVYRCVNEAVLLLGKGADTALAALEPLFDSLQDATTETPQREAVLAALNGVMGDRLDSDGNPFATPMTLRYQGALLDWHDPPPIPESRGKVLLLIHGLCMNDLQWRTRNQTGIHDHGQAVQSTLGFTPVYLRYNSGLHTSQNGRQLAAQLEQLIESWPSAIEQLSVLAYSMGGLLIRSAVHYAIQDSLRWPSQLKDIVFLGTPHHGAPLEKAGHWLDQILGGTPYTAPFAKLGQLRSAGITDLRHGNVRDQDWDGRNRFERNPDLREHVPLPAGVRCHALAATTASSRSALAERLIGDGLVPLNSALGQHADPQRCLSFQSPSKKIVYKTNHLALLSERAVSRQIVRWLD
jgi:hypothetical protein